MARAPCFRTTGLTISLLALVFWATKLPAYPGAAFNNVLGAAQVVRGQSSSSQSSGSGSQVDGDAADYFSDEVQPVIAANCLACHTSGGIAESGGARLLFAGVAAANQTDTNYNALTAYLDGVGRSARLLSKISGTDHGGGQVLPRNSSGYAAFETFVALGGTVKASAALWDGVVFEDNRETLRRAALLFGATLPESGGNKLIDSDQVLRAAVRDSMQGEAFRDFIRTGVDDKLLQSGFSNGAPFDFDIYRFPDSENWAADYYEQVLNETGDAEYAYFESNFLELAFADALWREALSLVAFIVDEDRPYTEVLTADYTVVNGPLSIPYRSGDLDICDVDTWVQGENRGWVAVDDRFEVEEVGFATNRVLAHGSFIRPPHAGVLSTPGFLARFPSTDTNRNRARARWTYYHFLGVDIENSAPRSTDPVALADTNNPTMNNPACTVCHERLDPIAGAYQAYGNFGGYLSSYGGKDSLPECYKYPEQCGGSPGDTEYLEGEDTWFRDMRPAGYEGGAAAPQSLGPDTLPWLGQAIAADPRFAAAQVRFWWSAVMGAEPLLAPEDTGAPDFAARQLAFEAQDEAIQTLADRFAAGGFVLRDLLADMVMTPWFRAAGMEMPDDDPRWDTLAEAGPGRILGPEELDRKLRATLGHSWRINPVGDTNSLGCNPDLVWSNGKRSELTVDPAGYPVLYGGSDGFQVIERSRDATALIKNLGTRVGVELAGSTVLYEFSYPQSERRVFADVDRYTRPDSFGVLVVPFEGPHDATPAQARQQSGRTLSLDFQGTQGDALLAMHSSANCGSDGCSWTYVDEVRLYRGNSLLERFSGLDLQNYPGRLGEGWEWEGGFSPNPAIFPLSLPGTGSYRLEADVWGNSDGVPHESPARFLVDVRTSEPSLSSLPGQLMRPQLESLHQRFIGAVPDEGEIERMYDILVAVTGAMTDRHLTNEDWQTGFLSEWVYGRIPGWEINPETDAEWSELLHDPQQAMTAWTVALDYLLTHKEFTHD